MSMRLSLVLLAMLLAPFLASGQAGSADGGSTVGIPVPDTIRQSPVGTENVPRRVTSGVSTSELIRLAPSLGYVAIPGDVYTFDIFHYGGSGGAAEHLEVQVPVEDDYTLQVPLIAAPMNVRGMTFAEIRKLALTRLRATVRLQHADVAIASPAFFMIQITGAVAQPGRIVVNGLTRVSDALDAAGGVLPGASWRRIEHRGPNGLVLLDLLGWAAGNAADANPMVRPGDSIHVGLTTTGATVRGRVRYPGTYELLRDESLSDLLGLAGGVLTGSDLKHITLTRIAEDGAYTVLDLDATANPDFRVSDGDIVSVASAARNTPVILVDGALFGSVQDPASPSAVPRSGVTVQIPYTPGVTLLAVLERLGGPTPYADATRSYVQRRSGQRVEVDVDALWQGRESSLDVALEPGDHVVVPIVALNVAVLGEVRLPGPQGYVPGLTVADYVRGAGGAVDGRGSLVGIQVQERQGSSRVAALGDEVPPGATIYVKKQVAAAVGDFFRDNVFVITGVAVTILSIATTVIEFVQLLISL